ncbi:MAG: GreA/GreB family elongation factor [Deltaproteobacteria bacterium]|nr:GreA/GreB family elongation factor [Deltaproteobacteria bacterium]
MKDKAALRTELVAALEEALAAARAAHAAAIEGATHAEAKAENDKDTRGLEQSYLARGVAQRVVDLETAVADVTRLELRTFAAGAPAAMSALVTVDEEGEEQTFFLAPAGGGTVLSSNVQVVTTSSPLGRALLGKRVDDEVELKLPGKTRAFVISAIR